MIRLLIWLLIIYIGFRIVKSLAAPKVVGSGDGAGRAAAEATHRDPI
jgi:hypothetical protein